MAGPPTPQCLSMLRMALRSCKPKLGLAHHPDQGSRYASLDYQAALRAAGLGGSMSRKGELLGQCNLSACPETVA